MQSYNEMLAVRAGNLLLHNWVLATDNFLLTDLPIYLLASFVVGPGRALIYLVPFVVFVLLLLGCLLLVTQIAASRRRRRVGAYAVLLLLGLPYGLHYNFFFWSDFHVATLTICLYAILLVSPALSDRRFDRRRLVPFIALVFAAAFSDPLADGLLLGPLILFVILRAWLSRRFRPDDWLLVGSVLLGVLASILVLSRLSRAGAFFTLPSVTMDLVPTAPDVARNGRALLAGAQMLFTARAGLVASLPLHHLIAGSRSVVALSVAILTAATVWRMPKAPDDGVPQLLVLSALCLTALAAMSSTFKASVAAGADYPAAAVRFVVPVFVFLCVAASIELGRLGDHRAAVARVVTAVGLVFGLVYVVGAIATVGRLVGQPPAIRIVPQRLLADWLVRQGLTYGVGDYWDTQLVVALSEGKVVADPVTQLDGRLGIFTWLMDATRFKSKTRPQFVIITPGDVFGVTLPAVTATYGAPSGVTLVADRYYVARLRP